MITPSDRRDAASVLDDVGYVVLEGIGSDEVQGVLGDFGEITPFLGEWKYDVEARDELATLYTARSHEPLYPHLDKYEWSTPPDIVALYGRRCDRGGQGHTYVCDMAPFLDALGGEDQHRLRTTPISYEADEGLQAVGIDHRHHGPPLDLTDPQWPRFRFSYNYSLWPAADDAGFTDLWQRARTWYEAHKQAVLLTQDTLLVWRNTLVLHSRDGFVDPDRLLWRVYLSRRSLTDA